MDPNTEIELAIQKLRSQNQISSTEFFGLIGTTVDGQTAWFPNSLQRGYQDELTPISERPKMLWQFLGIVGYFSDGNYNYLPSYNQGREIARELKTNVIASQTLKLTNISQEQEKSIKKLEDTVKNMNQEIDNLKRELNKKEK